MRKLLLASLVAGVLLVPSASMGSHHKIKATNNDTWNPVTKTVTKGTKVVWTNPSNDDHNVKAYSENWSKSSQLPEGEQTSKRFRKKGTFKYYCSIHGHVTNSGECHGMCGKVRVTAPN